MMAANVQKYGLLKVFAAAGDKCTKLRLSLLNYSIGSSCHAIIRVIREGVEPLHCEVRVEPSGLALLVNKSISNPVPVNGKVTGDEMYLLPDDSFTIMGKRFLYENPELSYEILEHAKQKNKEYLIDYLKKRRYTLTPQPERRPRIRTRRSASLDNVAENASGRNENRLFTVSTPTSATRPSLRSSAISDHLSMMNFSESECEPSAVAGDNRELELQTPVDDIAAEDEELTTPLTNVSVIAVESSFEGESTPLRSRKSKAKDISIQRLTQNDDSVYVLDTPDSKTPKSALKAAPTKTSVGRASKINLMYEFSGSETSNVDTDNSMTEHESSGVVPSSQDACSDVAVEDVGVAACSTPSSKRSDAEVSFQSSEDEDLDEEFGNTLSASETGDFNLLPGMKRKRESTSEEVDCKRLKPAELDESLDEVHSFTSQDFTAANEQEFDMQTTPLARDPRASVTVPRKAFTEPRQTKRTITRRSLCDRIENQENEPLLEASNSTLETVDTSSFVYVKNNAAFEDSHFDSSTSQEAAEGGEVAGVKKLVHTPKVPKEPLNDLSNPTDLKRLPKTPVVERESDDMGGASGVEALTKAPDVDQALSNPEQRACNATSVFDVSGVSSLPEDDVFPAKRVCRTYGKSLAAGVVPRSPRLSRKTVGDVVEVSPDVEQWVEASMKARPAANDTEPVVVPTQSAKSPAEAAPEHRSVRVSIDASQIKAAARGFRVEERGRSLPALKGTRETEGECIRAEPESEAVVTANSPTSDARGHALPAERVRSANVQGAEGGKNEGAEESDNDATVPLDQADAITAVQDQTATEQSTTALGEEGTREAGKDETVFKTPQLLSPARSSRPGRKSGKRVNTVEGDLEPREREVSEKSRRQKEPLNDLSDPKGLKKLFATPRIHKEPRNDLSSPKGVKRLLRTPKPQKGPKDDLTSPRGMKRLLATPKPVKEPKNDLRNPAGVRALMRTPRQRKEPRNDLSNLDGVQELFQTPEVVLAVTSSRKKTRSVSADRTPRLRGEEKNEVLSGTTRTRTRRNAPSVEEAKQTDETPLAPRAARRRAIDQVEPEAVQKAEPQPMRNTRSRRGQNHSESVPEAARGRSSKPKATAKEDAFGAEGAEDLPVRSRRARKPAEASESEHQRVIEIPAKRARRGHASASKKDAPESLPEVVNEPAKRSVRRRRNIEEVEEGAIDAQPATKTAPTTAREASKRGAEPPADEAVGQKAPPRRGGRRAKAEDIRVDPPTQASPTKAALRSRRKLAEETMLQEAVVVVSEQEAIEADAVIKVAAGRRRKAPVEPVRQAEESSPQTAGGKRARRGRAGIVTTTAGVEESVRMKTRANRSAKSLMDCGGVQQIVTKTREVKGVTSSTISVKKRVSFNIRASEAMLPLTPETPARLTKRRLKSEEEMNGSYEQKPARVLTRSRK